MNEITLTGNVGQIRSNQTRSGDTVLSFSLGVNDRERDGSGEWRDAPTVWHQVVVFGRTAENALASISTGTLVTVTGKFADNSFTPDGGDTVRRIQLKARAIAVDLTFVQVSITKTGRASAASEPTAPAAG